jgi:YggT family protein
MSWVPEIKHTKIGQLIDRIANPFMRIFRGIIVIGMFDLTPMLGLFLYQLGLTYLGQMVNIMVSQGL